MKKLILIVIVLGAGAAWAWNHWLGGDAQSTAPRTSAIERGDLEVLVSGTGTLSAVGTVEVGSQVSGRIAEIRVDFNDRVEAGQILAVLDTANLGAAVRDADANLARARAQYEQAAADRDRNRKLFERGYVSEREYQALETAATVAQASLASAQAGVERAQANLDYAWIEAPIAGTVIQRAVEAGQTVQASLQAPTLFVIAEDLRRMEILAQVDESDIGQIADGQSVRFTVQAHPDDEYAGTVRQVRLQPETVQNVVMYTVVIDADNLDGLLMPGMTATVDFVVDRAEEVLLLPNAALSFAPTADMLAALPPRGQAGPGAGRARPGAGGTATHEAPQGDRESDNGVEAADRAVVWYLDDTGTARPAPVRTGLSDGLHTVLVDAGPLAESAQVVIGATGTTATTTAAQRSTRADGGPRGPGGPGGPPGLF